MANKFSKTKAGSTLKKAVQNITSWSYSRYSKWKECPAAAKFKFIDKIEEDQNAAMKNGERVHKLAEDFALKKLKKIPAELKNFKEEFAELQKSKPICEQMWCFTKDWNETHDKDWNGIWVRMKIDAVAVDGTDGYVIDHKTGKNRGGYGDQMELSAVATFIKFPHLKRVVTQLWFLDITDPMHRIVEAEYFAKDLEALKKKWEKRVAPMLNDTAFLARPGNACRWCAFAKVKGGPCKY